MKKPDNNMHMRVGVINPNLGFLTGDRSMHRWAEQFMRLDNVDVITYEEAKEYDGDVLVSLNGRPDLHKNHPPKEFKGLKIVHLMDHVFQTDSTLQVLKDNDVSHVMCYNRHDLHDKFFQHFYKDYCGKVIAVPFGYNDLRFSDQQSFQERKNKCIALGSVNPVRDAGCMADIARFMEFYKDEEFTHKWRRILSEGEHELRFEMDSVLPAYPKTKDFDYDIVKAYNSYRMFTSGESIMNYPSVKTFEGMACGSALVCSNHECYTSLGFIDGQNCIMHEQNNLLDFKVQINYYQNSYKELEKIARAGKKFVEHHYNPRTIALDLFSNIEHIWT